MGSRAAVTCLLLCVLHLIAGEAAHPIYMVTFPYVIYYPHGGKVHIHLVNLDEPTRVTLSLRSSHSIPNVTLEVMGNKSLQLDWPLFPNITTPAEELAYVHVTIQGSSLSVSRYRKVLLKAPGLWTTIQMDRTAYKPGQTVKFRILRLDEDFMPSDRKLPSVTVHDPRGNSIVQWQDVTPQQGIVDLSLLLARDAALGTYTIETEEKNHTFEVTRLWNPRFKVLLQLPSFVMEMDEKIPLHVCGRYSSGKPFQGKAEATLCHFHKSYLRSSNESSRCVMLEGQVKRNGCFSTQVSTALFNLTSSDHVRRLFANASLTDEDTGRTKTITKSCKIFPEMPLNASKNTNGFNENGTPYDGMDSSRFLRIRRMKAIPPCIQPLEIQVDYNFSMEVLKMKPGSSLEVFVLILVKETLVTILRKELFVDAALSGSFSIELPAAHKLVPTATVSCYTVVPEGWVLFDWTLLHVPMCFPNQVKLSFPEQKVLAGSQTQLKVQAAPGSLCAIHITDEHTWYAGLKATTNSNTVSSLHLYSEVSFYSEDEGQKFIDCPFGNRPSCSIPLNPYDVPKELIIIRRKPKRHKNRKGRSYFDYRNLCDPDTDAALKSVTNTGLDMCLLYLSRTPGKPEVDEHRIWLDQAQQMEFLGTWLWKLVPVGEDGSAEVTVTMPDAIKEWKAGMFCTAPTGVGMAPTATLVTYKPFSVELALPYAVTIGKSFAVAATIFNHLQHCLWVRVMLEDSENLEVLERADEAGGGCVCGYEARTFQWDVRAISPRKVNVTISAQALSTEELCGSEVPVVPAQRDVDTVTKLLVVKVNLDGAQFAPLVTPCMELLQGQPSSLHLVLSSPGQGDSGDGVHVGSALGPELSWHISGWEGSEDVTQTS